MQEPTLYLKNFLQTYKVCPNKSVYLYKKHYSLKVYRFAYAHFKLTLNILHMYLKVILKINIQMHTVCT